jgi:hypothetical protein
MGQGEWMVHRLVFLHVCIYHGSHYCWCPHILLLVLCWYVNHLSSTNVQELHASKRTLRLTFVGTPDAVMIAARFMASAIICRIIVAYELAGMAAAEGTRARANFGGGCYS